MDRSDRKILTALHGIQFGQEAVLARTNDGVGPMGNWLKYLAGHYRELPAEVARRLTAIDPAAIAALEGGIPRGAALAETLKKVAGPQAVAQVKRAVNVYRQRLGLVPPEADGEPVS